MSVASVDELKEELSFSGDLGDVDDAMMQRHLTAAEQVLEKSLGFALAVEFPDGEPEAIKQAVLWLAVEFYDGRGGGDGLPAHVENIISHYREWSF